MKMTKAMHSLDISCFFFHLVIQHILNTIFSDNMLFYLIYILCNRGIYQLWSIRVYIFRLADKMLWQWEIKSSKSQLSCFFTRPPCPTLSNFIKWLNKYEHWIQLPSTGSWKTLFSSAKLLVPEIFP